MAFSSWSFLVACMFSAITVNGAAIQRRQNSCPANFLNTVFNGPTQSEPDWQGRWDFLKSNGLSQWIGFSPDAAPAAAADQIRLATHIEDIPTLMSAMGPGMPVVGSFNEPDGGFYGLPFIDYQDALNAMIPMIDLNSPTKILSPAGAYNSGPNGDKSWLQKFMIACGEHYGIPNCKGKFEAISIHIYVPDAQGAKDMIDATMAQPELAGNDFWITELAPAPLAGNAPNSPGLGCTISNPDMSAWMTDVLTHCVEKGIKRVFWNCGEAEVSNICNPSLTNQDPTSGTPLLDTYRNFCGSTLVTASSVNSTSNPAVPVSVGAGNSSTSRRDTGYSQPL